ncbi:family 20 glycosylhydrolase [Carboxylicivirga caseinilyticus]|uniref:family 20 glycosylhydrolase n=1 Tax=Carboxylicivirga caseinilyticus TaxID=3417572 RepID=UPI003D32E11D|nr:family 20 glycosylhydrolase [Marinilabiliaceae bacterium A049]
MKRALLFTLSCFVLHLVYAQYERPDLLPFPQKVEWKDGFVNLAGTTLSLPDSLMNMVQQQLNELGCTVEQKSDRHLEIKMVEALKDVPLNQDEAYHLTINETNISIRAVTKTGIYRALQTLNQLVVKQGADLIAPNCHIVDWPAFKIRGFMHDVGRSYIPVEELKKQIALLSQFKINVFHWHLTEDIAWRLESKVFPQLNDSSNFERQAGKYYTIEEVKDLVKFCQEHHVLLIPEIDMPGHSAAFTRALGHDMQSPEGMKLLKQLMDEVCEVFADVPYIHIGTDEVKFTNPDFVPEMVGYIRSKGKKVISWNPGWNYKQGEIDMLQMWSARGKVHPGIPAIDSRLHYINHFDTFADIIALYHSNVAGVSEANADVVGSIVAIWNDRYVDETKQVIAENGFYPSMLALAESTWQGGRDKYFYEQGTLLGAVNSEDFKVFKDFEERMLHFKKNVFSEEPFAYVKQTNVKWRITDAFPNNGNLSQVFPPEKKLQKAYEYRENVYSTHEVTGAGIYLRHVWGTLIPGFYANPQPNHTAYAYTWVYSPIQQEAGIYVRFQNYGRSEKDLPPPQGKWDYKGSRIWLNDKEIQPPVWENTHTIKSNEISLRNENWEGRPPIQVQLNKGWNKLLLKLPIGEFKSPEVRLVKWMFNAVIVTTDGRQALDNIFYSPDKDFKTVEHEQ